MRRDRQTHTDVDERYTPETLVDVSNYINCIKTVDYKLSKIDYKT